MKNREICVARILKVRGAVSDVMTYNTEAVMPSGTPRALVVGGGTEVLPGLQPMLGGRRFHVDFLDRSESPYNAVRRRRPDLIVLCFTPEDDEACQLMAMLQLDPATRRLPILTYVGGEVNAIIPSQWPRTSGIPSASSSLEPCTVR
ncbi:MAG: hypothetical protein ABI665_18145 [Vicinamibacterales bacterium]